jgi:hypothetical protein
MVWKYFEFFQNASDAPMKIVREYIDPLVHKALEERDKYQTLSKEEQAETSDSFLRFLAMSTEGVYPPLLHRLYLTVRKMWQPSAMNSSQCSVPRVIL